MPTPLLRPETRTDFPSIDTLLRAAFETPAEARLVAALRSEQGTCGYVAAEEERVLGHLMFSPVSAEHAAPGLRAVGLAPLAVLPAHQCHGIGAALVRHGLAACAAEGVGLVALLGDPAYYGRFGFVPGSRHGLSCRWSDGDEFQVLELVHGYAERMSGRIGYHPLFDTLE